MLNVRYNNGSGQFSGGYTDTRDSWQGHGGQIAMADIDNDGDLDLLRAGLDAPVFKQLNDGTGRFGAPTQLTPVNVGELKFADIDADGDLDLVALFRGYSGIPAEATVLLNDGSGNFSKVSAINIMYNQTGMEFGDMDADGDLDLLIMSGYSLSVYFNNGQGRFSGYYQLTAPALDAFTLGDIDGDNDLDLVAVFHPNSPPSPPCPMYTYFNQPISPALVTSVRAGHTELETAVYPNPAQQRCTLTFAAPVQEGRLVLYNAMGQAVRSQDVPTVRSLELSLADLAPGVYTLHVNSHTGSAIRRIVKQ
ncbi:T9SS type A sorting domain-containing protein [Hymenobacter cellulosilyticus]|uniref:T9SS type A sorting domain-containing protein n=1 Tax=Hymenobacter cellulosilyticus TaxID=2932248 RepID=A0A8T9Q4Y5_9BACT|nr:T9SS type A sorting domain-containing protein [Hymenobacter cellulosilyticus]UOQ71491.1 T9SS type A sorting domain-containing protein [Hymenobacter cellulosilyticus]